MKGLEIIDSLTKMITSKEEVIPFSFLSPFTHLIEGVLSLFVATFKESLLENLLKIGDFNVNKLKDSQIK